MERREIALIIEDAMHGIEWAAGKRPGIDDLERMLNSDEVPAINILPDGSITAGEPRAAAYKAADTIIERLTAPDVSAAKVDTAAQEKETGK